ncbi:MAG: patatin-like phospholipase family protein [Pseudomonadota bacterium]
MYRPDPVQQPKELAAVKAWRAGKNRNEPVDDLVGVALSGGGIRSATFGLGVLERLKDIGLLERVDFLSSVSGGGYIGAWLSVNCKRRQQAAAQKASWLSRGADWSVSIAHLRRYSKYLSPEVGLLSADTWTMGTIWMRNALLTQTIIVLMIAFLLLLPRVMHKWFVLWPAQGDWRWITVALFSAAAGGIARNQRQLSIVGGESSKRYRSLGSYLVGVACIAGIVWISSLIPGGVFSDKRSDNLVMLIALLALVAGYYLMPAVEAVVFGIQRRRARSDKTTLTAEYGQGAVQRFVVVPMLAVGFLLGSVLWGQSMRVGSEIGHINTYGKLWLTAPAYWELPLVLAFGALSLFACRSTNKQQRGWLKNSLVVLLATACSGLVLHSLLTFLMLSMNGMHDLAGASWRVMVWLPPAILFSFSLAVVMLIGIQGIDALESVREWWSRMGAWLCIYGMAWMIVMTATVYGPVVASFLLSKDTWTIGSALLTPIITTAVGIFAGKSGATGTNERARSSPITLVLNAIALLAPVLVIAGLLIAVSTGIHILTAFLAGPDNYMWEGFAVMGAVHWAHLGYANLPYYSELLLIVVAFALAIMAWRVDINEFSLNAFYRNRLARCYLGATRKEEERHAQSFTGFDPNDDMDLHELCESDKVPAGPFHIFNCALNLGGSSDLDLHTRHSASYTLTPLFVGSRYTSRRGARESDTGTLATRDFGRDAKQPLTVAKAMAVSGAAASPNMGFHTSPLVAFALTFFNMRLGWWFPSAQKAKASSPAFGLMYLVYEMLGLATAQSDFLMISDGGHFENMGAYELIARRCRVIIISDGECDPELKFEGLGKLIRMSRVDHGTDIAIDVRPIKSCTQSFAVGTISYPEKDRKPGILVYLKASLTGAEGTDVLQYKSIHDAFPHESTGNQFYGEDQFESYRSLGTEVASRALTGMSFEDGDMSAAQVLQAHLKITSQAAGSGPS